jgi:hypothetical protein
MRMSSAAVGTLVTALALGAVSCRTPTGAPDEPNPVASPVTTHAAILVVRSALDGHWLAAGDSVAVRLSLAPDEEAAHERRAAGVIAYDGVPVWRSARGAAGAFAATYFTHDGVADRLIGVFFDADIARGRLLLFVRPEPFAITWVVTASGAGGAPVELARGDAVATP